MFKGPQGMSLAGNAAAAAAAASAAATSAADKTKMCASNQILPKGLPSESTCYQVIPQEQTTKI